MPGTAQLVATVPVFDYLYDTQGKALSNAEVVIQLEFNRATAIAPVVSLPSTPIRVTTDPTGYWTAGLVPNSNINPANTVYTVRAGGQSFQISVPAGPGPYQASAIATTTPPAMVPAGPFTAGSVLFAGPNGAATQDNGLLSWDDTNKKAVIGGDIAARSLTASNSPYNPTAPAGWVQSLGHKIGSSFTNPLTSSLYVAPDAYNAPATNDTAAYVQARLTGTVGGSGLAIDAFGADLLLDGTVNTTGFCIGAEFTINYEQGVNTIADARVVTINATSLAGVTGTTTSLALLRAQTMAALPGGMAITNLYGLYVEPQTVGGTNYSVYAPTGTSLFGKIIVDGTFSTAFDVPVYISPANRASPVLNYTGVFAQVRVSGTVGAGLAMDAISSNLTLNGLTNATGFNNSLEASLIANAGAYAVNDIRGITVNFNTNGVLTGTFTRYAGIQVQATGTLGGAAITTLYGLYLEQQTVGATNWSLYVAGGSSFFGGHVNAGGAAPTSAGPAANCAITINASSTDFRGQFTITTSAAIAANTTLFTLTWAGAYGDAANFLVMSAANGSAADLQFYTGTPTATGVPIICRAGLNTTTAYVLNYHNIGHA